VRRRHGRQQRSAARPYPARCGALARRRWLTPWSRRGHAVVTNLRRTSLHAIASTGTPRRVHAGRGARASTGLHTLSSRSGNRQFYAEPYEVTR
jgi:hypothetical protein